jgi:hypothetical protein
MRKIAAGVTAKLSSGVSAAIVTLYPLLLDLPFTNNGGRMLTLVEYSLVLAFRLVWQIRELNADFPSRLLRMAFTEWWWSTSFLPLARTVS